MEALVVTAIMLLLLMENENFNLSSILFSTAILLPFAILIWKELKK